MKKKVLFFVMAFVMSALLIPNVYAEGVVAKIGSDEYSTLQQAVNAVENGGTITLVANTNEDITIAAGKKFTLDLGTYTLTNVSSHTIVNNGDLTITGKGTIDNVTHGKGDIVNNYGATLVLKGEIEDRVVAIDKIFSDYPEITFAEEYDRYLHNGNRILKEQMPEDMEITDEKYRVYDSGKCFIGVYEFRDEVLYPVKIFYEDNK